MEIARKQGRIDRSVQHIESMMQQMEEDTRQRLLDASITARTRKAIETAHKRYVLRQGLRVRQRFSPEQKRWMRLLIVDRLLENPGLHDKLRGMVEQLRMNYGFEWVSCPFTILAQQEARKMMLMAAESEFGDTPMAGPLALVRYHHRQYNIQDITNYDEAYLRAVRLDEEQYFADKGAALREELGVKTPVAQSKTEPARNAAPEPQPSES